MLLYFLAENGAYEELVSGDGSSLSPIGSGDIALKKTEIEEGYCDPAIYINVHNNQSRLIEKDKLEAFVAEMKTHKEMLKSEFEVSMEAFP